jgi:hypothetical protein
MSRTDYRTLLDRGRKAGLSTSELYGAMMGTRHEGNDRALGQADSNGFVSSFDQHGHRVYRPLGSMGRNN